MRKPTTEETLHDLGAAFTRRADGVYVVPHDIKLGFGDLKELPDLSNVIVKGNFVCQTNLLTSLKGCPREVEGDFWCHHNLLTSLEGCPAKVGGNFWCQENSLTSLAHAPASIGGYFYCEKNKLANLEGAPRDFIAIDSDFGRFTSWDAIPDYARLGPEALNREAEKAASKQTLECLRKVANNNRSKLKKLG